MCALTIVMEGTSEEVSYQKKKINKLAKSCKGMIGDPATVNVDLC